MLTILIAWLVSTRTLIGSEILLGSVLLKIGTCIFSPSHFVFSCKLISLMTETCVYRTWFHHRKAGFNPNQCNNRVRSMYKSFFIWWHKKYWILFYVFLERVCAPFLFLYFIVFPVFLLFSVKILYLVRWVQDIKGNYSCSPRTINYQALTANEWMQTIVSAAINEIRLHLGAC